MVEDVVERFRAAVGELDVRLAGERLDDADVDAELHTWLDRPDPLPWADPVVVTPDEWFFVTTLYGEMTLDGQRTHIRRFFPTLFVAAAGRDTRNFVSDMPGYDGLRSGWMWRRLSTMGDILRMRHITMNEYVEGLRQLDAKASPFNPMPALDAVIADHQATGWKTLSVFVRDCVKGNAFPIDTRVGKELRRHGLPDHDERLLVSLALDMGRDPRKIARMFYTAGGYE